MKIKLPVTYEVCGFITLEADSISKAICFFEENADLIKLPEDVEYVDGSFNLSTYDLDILKYYNDFKF